MFVLLFPRVTATEVCYSEDVDKPIFQKRGDFIIAGIFNLGSLEEKFNKLVYI